jgi:hypothetical protein
MKKAFPILLMLLGLVFAGAGTYTMYRGFDAKNEVKDELVAQDIQTTPDARELVGIAPGLQVNSAHRAEKMAQIIDHHSLESSGGLTYSQMGRFAVASGDPAGTNDEAAALKGADGKPVANSLRNTLFQASALRTSLYTSVMAFNVADLVIGLGLMILVLGFAVGGMGVALGGLAIPTLARKVHVDPLAAEYHPTAS